MGNLKVSTQNVNFLEKPQIKSNVKTLISPGRGEFKGDQNKPSGVGTFLGKANPF